MCCQKLHTYVCRRCNRTTREMNFEIVYCDSALRSGMICQYPDIRTRTISEPGCQYCGVQRSVPAPTPTFHQTHPSYAAQTHNFSHQEPFYQPVPYAYPPAVHQQHTVYGRSFHQEDQLQGNLRSTNQPNRLVVSPPENYSLPGLSQYEHPAHWDMPSNRSQPQPYERRHAPRPEHKYHEPTGPATYRAMRTYKYEEEQEKLAAAEQADLQRALEESRREHVFNNVKRACSGQGKRISALENQMERGRELVQHEREDKERARYERKEEQYRAELEQYLAEKAAWEASQNEAIPADGYLEDPRGLPAGQKPSCMPTQGRKGKEVWVRDVRKVNGKLVEYRRKLKSWEYELR